MDGQKDRHDKTLYSKLNTNTQLSDAVLFICFNEIDTDNTAQVG